jgi:hypothetical protein
MKYRDSKYLIKPTNVGRGSSEDYVSNVSLLLQKAFITQGITCDNIDITNLSVEDIRRSGLIYLFSPENKNIFNIDLITLLYGFKNSSGLYWLQNYAREKYK